MTATRSRTFETLRRKVEKSISQRGITGTVSRCAMMPFLRLRGFVRSHHPAVRRLRAYDRQWDETHNVDTCLDADAGWMSEIQSANWEFGRGYHPAPTDALTEVLRELSIPFEDYTFIDLGSGKGRSLFVASDFPFLEIVGVEYSRRLHEIATQNVKSYVAPEQRCRNITPVHIDASEYEFPTGPLVIYLYDPFGEPVMSNVVENIRATLHTSPRSAYVVYFNPVFADLFEQLEGFEQTLAGAEFERYWQRSSSNRDANEFESELLDGQRFVVYRFDADSFKRSTPPEISQESR